MADDIERDDKLQDDERIDEQVGLYGQELQRRPGSDQTSEVTSSMQRLADFRKQSQENSEEPAESLPEHLQRPRGARIASRSFRKYGDDREKPDHEENVTGRPFEGGEYEQEHPGEQRSYEGVDVEEIGSGSNTLQAGLVPFDVDEDGVDQEHYNQAGWTYELQPPAPQDLNLLDMQHNYGLFEDGQEEPELVDNGGLAQEQQGLGAAFPEANDLFENRNAVHEPADDEGLFQEQPQFGAALTDANDILGDRNLVPEPLFNGGPFEVQEEPPAEPFPEEMADDERRRRQDQVLEDEEREAHRASFLKDRRIDRAEQRQLGGEVVPTPYVLSFDSTHYFSFLMLILVFAHVEVQNFLFLQPEAWKEIGGLSARTGLTVLFSFVTALIYEGLLMKVAYFFLHCQIFASGWLSTQVSRYLGIYYDPEHPRGVNDNGGGEGQGIAFEMLRERLREFIGLAWHFLCGFLTTGFFNLTWLILYELFRQYTRHLSGSRGFGPILRHGLDFYTETSLGMTEFDSRRTLHVVLLFVPQLAVQLATCTFLYLCAICHRTFAMKMELQTREGIPISRAAYMRVRFRFGLCRAAALHLLNFSAFQTVLFVDRLSSWPSSYLPGIFAIFVHWVFHAIVGESILQLYPFHAAPVIGWLTGWHAFQLRTVWDDSWVDRVILDFSLGVDVVAQGAMQLLMRVFNMPLTNRQWRKWRQGLFSKPNYRVEPIIVAAPGELDPDWVMAGPEPEME